MSATPLSVHTTRTIRSGDASGEVWDFSCQTCGYRARYTQNLHSGTSKLEILALGDELARHISNYDGPLAFGEEPLAQPLDNCVEGEEVWLPPELCAQIEAVLRRVHFAD
jgi:hypothetical protein